MSQWVASFMNRRFNVQPARTIQIVHLLGGLGAALLFTAVATIVMSFAIVFQGQTFAGLTVGDISPEDIDAPEDTTWISDVLTERGREEAVADVEDVYNLPDTNAVRQQTQVARQILDFISNVRRDIYGTNDQKLNDLQQITDLDLDEGVMLNILEMDEDTWRSVDEQIVDVLERVMQQSIRDSDLQAIISRLPTQVSVRFNTQEAAVITSIIGDLVRPNAFVNPQQTESAREQAREDFEPVRRTFAAGQRVVDEGRVITAADYEALQQLGLLEISPEERRTRRLTAISQSFMLSLTIVIVIGLYTARFASDLFNQPRFMLLAAVIYLLFLIGVRIVGDNGTVIYIYPTAAMALLFIAIISPEVAIISTLGMGTMIGFMLDQDLEMAIFVIMSGLMGTLTLRKAERLNSFFFAGLMIALINIIVIAAFQLNLAGLNQNLERLGTLLIYGALNGFLASMAAMALMYLVTILFNLPTGLRLVELSQPNNPLLQRLLREAPGTYQHSLQVANLSEQATNAIGGNAELVRVSALYHDIGKSLNAPFFVENQADGSNPHDELNDAYRSADIIISHVTEGDKLARQQRLPDRVRDFIREHHGTTRVEYFYNKAMTDADSQDEVDPADFTYPGPIPQSRETAIMMLADSCESTVRARRPSSKQEIQEIVQSIIDARTKAGQLDESGLTSNDIKTIRGVFVDMLQAVFHPRINYPSGLTKPAKPKTLPVTTTQDASKKRESREVASNPNGNINPEKSPSRNPLHTSEQEIPTITNIEEEENNVEPMPDVPPLPRRTSEESLTKDPDEQDK